MTERLVVACATSVAVVLWLAFGRRYLWQNLVWTGGGWTLTLIVLAWSFEEPGAGPALFLLGGAAGAMVQTGFGEEKARAKRTGTLR